MTADLEQRDIYGGSKREKKKSQLNKPLFLNKTLFLQ